MATDTISGQIWKKDGKKRLVLSDLEADRVRVDGWVFWGKGPIHVVFKGDLCIISGQIQYGQGQTVWTGEHSDA